MKLFRKLKNTFSRLPRKTAITMVALGLLIGVPVAITVAEFYPNRPAFDYNKACNSNDGDVYDRCGSLTGPVFNSFINTPSYGDERAFVDARRSDQTAAGSYKNVLPEVTGGSKEIVVRMYVHNNANQSTNASGLGVAKNTKVRLSVPTGTAQALRARGYISADNAAPQLVEDTVDFTAPEEFSVAYVPGSAILYNNGVFKNGTQLSDSIVTNGAPIGSDALNGSFKGCFEFEAVVQVRLKVTTKEKPKVELKKQVAVPGQTTWGEHVNVKPGDKVKWLISFLNTGQADLTNVNVNDQLPPHLTVVPGSVSWIYAGTDGSTQTVPLDNTQLFTTGGYNAGTWKPNGGFYVRFETTAKDDFNGCDVRLRNIAHNKSNQTPQVEDSADVTITKPNCQPVTPKYSCDLLQAKHISGRTYRFTTNTTATGGATVKQYNYEFVGDNYKENKVTNQPNGQVDHTFPATGSFVITVNVDFNVDGQVKSASGQACKTTITIPKTPTPPTTPTTPSELPNTGPGEIVGIFVSVTLAGALAHRFVLGRRGY